MRAAMWLNGELAREELHTLHLTYYFANELRLMLEDAGFVDIVLHGDHEEHSPTRRQRLRRAHREEARGTT